MRSFVCMASKLFMLLIYLQLASSQLSSDQVSTMSRVYEIFQNNTGYTFAWSNFDKGSNTCSWRGVECNSPHNSSITNLSFRLFSISTSEFLPILCEISTLESLDVSNNRLSSIPVEFFTVCREISALKLLNFSGNKLDGFLPAFTGFRTLEVLDFSYNSLAGEISSRFDDLDSLRSLNLSRNQFKGKLPLNLGKLNFLEELQLSFNSFTGEIPVEITKYTNLSLIDLSFNKLVGSIPIELSELTRLETLVLSENHLNGEIPQSFSRVKKLVRFAANQNNFTGTLPTRITSFLESLDLGFNKLGGTIPPDLLSGPNLQSLDLSNNNLEGSVPASISTRMFRLRLGGNSLNGTLPSAWFGNLQELMYLDMENNGLTGPIPPELRLCNKLALLNLAQNKFSGRLPRELGNLTNLQVLNLQSNNFVGEIPPEIMWLNKLQKLNISRNLLVGSIPSSISSLKDLTNLDLQGNNLSGAIPGSISNLTSLIELQLGKNQLIGEVPPMPRSLQIALNLSYNLLSGNIPVTLSRLRGLEVLDLSNNGFSGKIPDFLTEMTSLTLVVLSNNKLSGVVPTFGNYVVVETEGNMLLTYPPPNPTPEPQRKKKPLASDIIIAVATASVVFGFLIIVGIYVSRRYYKRINAENLHSVEEIIHGNLLTPNSIHRTSIDFRKAMEAVAEPSNITLKTRFSTYYKAVMPSGATYFVKKLNWSDKIFQLGSHDRFAEELQVLGKLCTSNVMIPLAYVLTANSAYLFYDFASKGTLFDILQLHRRLGNTLDWASRYSIAIGVSQGLAFLHDSGPILLLDLSTKSIFLKSLNEPRVGDIELCKVIDPSKSTGSLSTLAGSVGYVPPEYAYTMRVTAAGNVYSFGVILLELVTGKPAVSGGTELAKWALSNTTQHNKWDQILDSSVSKTSIAVRNQMLAVLKVALTCVSVSTETRPKMKSVLRMLLNAS
ncbi:Serine/threonine protein kinase [Handroanthus impetiginosus]|uniref:Serine/threonine protein kinase n=1 Tax=Handroanthus impetiginosus TaxID=429701 RepID=A0A2G9I164_9LAMI|nr:Serine/threonine protein kinase [Handroanthus impetiginosus]